VTREERNSLALALARHQVQEMAAAGWWLERIGEHRGRKPGAPPIILRDAAGRVRQVLLVEEKPISPMGHPPSPQEPGALRVGSGPQRGAQE
jgi:hypothetical protein